MARKILIQGVEWTVAKVKESIRGNDSALFKAILKVYEGQTSQEQRVSATTQNNGVGFNSADGYICSRYAEAIRQGVGLTPSDIRDARRRMEKYAAQVFKFMEQIAENNEVAF